MATLLEALQSEDREVRWNRIVWEASDLVRRDQKLIDESVVPFLTKEFTTDYSSYIADAQAKADKEWEWKKSLYAAWLVHRARENLSSRHEAGSKERANLQRCLATAEEKARECGIDVTAITRDGTLCIMEKTKLTCVQTHGRRYGMTRVFAMTRFIRQIVFSRRSW